LWEKEGAVFGLSEEKGGGGLRWKVRECRERGLHGQMERRWGGGLSLVRRVPYSGYWYLRIAR